MAKLEIKYRVTGGALPPRVPKVSFDTWAGSPEMKKENGSQPQPWHCPLHVAACTHGVELLYPHETETFITNDNGNIIIDWDRAKDPKGADGPMNFTLSVPAPPQNYLFATGLDLQAPPGYVLRAEPHPRYFADMTGTAPAALPGHIRTEWWPKKLFMVFKIPFPGQRHVFRKGDAYAQILFIPEDACEVVAMTPDEESCRRQLDNDIRIAKSLIGKRVWHSAGGVEFNDHYTVLARTFEKEGKSGLDRLVSEAVHRYKTCVPAGLAIPDYLKLAGQYIAESRFTEAKEVLHHIMRQDPCNAEAFNRMSQIEWEVGVPIDAVRTLSRAVELQPNEPQYRRNLGEFLRRVGRFEQSRQQFSAALSLRPNDPELLTVLGVVLSQLGQFTAAIDHCQRAIQIAPRVPTPHLALGMIASQQGNISEARTHFENALAIDPNFTPAREALANLNSPAPAVAT